MKFLIVALAVIGLACAAPSRNLDDDLKDILKVIPVKQMKAIADKHMTNDAEFQQVVKYLQGPEWAKLVADVAAKPQVQELNKFLEANGVDVDKILSIIHDIIANAKSNSRSVRSLRSFLDEIIAIFPLDKVMDVIDDKLTNSPDFGALYEKLASDDFRNLVHEVQAVPEVQRLRNRLIELGVDVVAVEEFFRNLLGWN